MPSRLARMTAPVNALLRRLRTPGRLIVIDEDWYNEDGLISAHNWKFVMDPAYSGAYESAVDRTGLRSGPKWRTHIALWVATNCSKLPGDFIEIGVGRGWMSSAIVHALEWNNLGKSLWLFDRFEDNDVDPVTGVQLSSRNSKGTYSSSIIETERTFVGISNVHLVAGTLPESLEGRPHGPIAFIHADLNAAVPEAESVERLWPSLVPGGMVLFDDFAYRGYSPQYSSTLEIARRLGTSVLTLPTGQGLAIKLD